MESWEEKLKCTLWELELEHPLVLGAGAAKHIDTEEGLEGFAKKTEASLLIGGTITYYPRGGNTGQVFYHEPNDCSKVINWYGMPNRGIVEITEHLSRVIEEMHARGQKVGVSVAGTVEKDKDVQLSIEEQYFALVAECVQSGADLIELNFGCPNTEKLPLSFSPESIFLILQRLGMYMDQNICVKLSPYLGENIPVMGQIAPILNASKVVKGISVTNTIPNQEWILPDGTYAITEGEHKGGLSGSCIHEMALEQVSTWRSLLDEDKYIIGGGGVVDKDGVERMLNAGADAVFMVSAPLVLGHRIFGKILGEMLDADP